MRYFFIIFILFNTISRAQKLEIGASAGLLQYKGDLQPNYNPFTGLPGMGTFVRYNLKNGLSIKAQGLAGFVDGKDKRTVSSYLHSTRNNAFRNFLYGGGGQLEYNFLNFRKTRALSLNENTFYLAAGYEFERHYHQKLVKTNTSTGLIQNIPVSNIPSDFEAIIFGLGFKKVWKSNWNMGIEFGARNFRQPKQATKTDEELDGLGVNTNNQNISISQTALNPNTYKLLYFNSEQLDRLFYLNFSVSYVFYKVKCPSPSRR